jgi:hypothetical protein
MGPNMNRMRHPRSTDGHARPRGRRRVRATPRAGSNEYGTRTAPADTAAFVLVSDILLGENHWTLAEIQGLISLAEQSDGDRWGAGLDGDETPGA